MSTWRHQAIIWTNVDFSSMVFCGIHLRAITRKMRKISILDMHLKMIISQEMRKISILDMNLKIIISQEMRKISILDMHLKMIISQEMRKISILDMNSKIINRNNSNDENPLHTFGDHSWHIVTWGPVDRVELFWVDRTPEVGGPVHSIPFIA